MVDRTASLKFFPCKDTTDNLNLKILDHKLQTYKMVIQEHLDFVLEGHQQGKVIKTLQRNQKSSKGSDKFGGLDDNSESVPEVEDCYDMFVYSSVQCCNWVTSDSHVQYSKLSNSDNQKDDNNRLCLVLHRNKETNHIRSPVSYHANDISYYDNRVNNHTSNYDNEVSLHKNDICHHANDVGFYDNTVCLPASTKHKENFISLGRKICLYLNPVKSWTLGKSLLLLVFLTGLCSAVETESNIAKDFSLAFWPPCHLHYPITTLKYERDPQNCSAFYMCFAGKYWKMSCMNQNTVFSAKYSVCVWKGSNLDDCPEELNKTPTPIVLQNKDHHHIGHMRYKIHGTNTRSEYDNKLNESAPKENKKLLKKQNVHTHLKEMIITGIEKDKTTLFEKDSNERPNLKNLVQQPKSQRHPTENTSQVKKQTNTLRDRSLITKLPTIKYLPRGFSQNSLRKSSLKHWLQKHPKIVYTEAENESQRYKDFQTNKRHKEKTKSDKSGPIHEISNFNGKDLLKEKINYQAYEKGERLLNIKNNYRTVRNNFVSDNKSNRIHGGLKDKADISDKQWKVKKFEPANIYISKPNFSKFTKNDNYIKFNKRDISVTTDNNEKHNVETTDVNELTNKVPISKDIEARPNPTIRRLKQRTDQKTDASFFTKRSNESNVIRFKGNNSSPNFYEDMSPEIVEVNTETVKLSSLSPVNKIISPEDKETDRIFANTQQVPYSYGSVKKGFKSVAISWLKEQQLGSGETGEFENLNKKAEAVKRYDGTKHFQYRKLNSQGIQSEITKDNTPNINSELKQISAWNEPKGEKNNTKNFNYNNKHVEAKRRPLRRYKTIYNYFQKEYLTPISKRNTYLSPESAVYRTNLKPFKSNENANKTSNDFKKGKSKKNNHPNSIPRTSIPKKITIDSKQVTVQPRTIAPRPLVRPWHHSIVKSRTAFFKPQSTMESFQVNDQQNEATKNPLRMHMFLRWLNKIVHGKTRNITSKKTKFFLKSNQLKKVHNQHKSYLILPRNAWLTSQSVLRTTNSYRKMTPPTPSATKNVSGYPGLLHRTRLWEMDATTSQINNRNVDNKTKQYFPFMSRRQSIANESPNFRLISQTRNVYNLPRTPNLIVEGQDVNKNNKNSSDFLDIKSRRKDKNYTKLNLSHVFKELNHPNTNPKHQQQPQSKQILHEIQNEVYDKQLDKNNNDRDLSRQHTPSFVPTNHQENQVDQKTLNTPDKLNRQPHLLSKNQPLKPINIVDFNLEYVYTDTKSKHISQDHSKLPQSRVLEFERTKNFNKYPSRKRLSRTLKPSKFKDPKPFKFDLSSVFDKDTKGYQNSKLSEHKKTLFETSKNEISAKVLEKKAKLDSSFLKINDEDFKKLNANLRLSKPILQKPIIPISLPTTIPQTTVFRHPDSVSISMTTQSTTSITKLREIKPMFVYDKDIVPPYRRELQDQCGIMATPLIIGGRKSRAGQWPWQVSLQIVSSTTPWHRCGGVLIHEKWVLTAAHCVEGAFYGDVTNWRAVMADYDLGTISGKEIYRDITRVISHPKYVRTTNFPNDVALLELDSPVDLTSGDVRTACLPDTNFPLKPGTKCWISGWGETRGSGGGDNIMNEVPVEILSQEECRPMWGKVDIEVLDNQVCLGYGDTGACYGDSGGPLMCESEGRFYVAGVMSWLISNCSANNFPNVFTRLPNYMDWLYGELDYFEWIRHL